MAQPALPSARSVTDRPRHRFMRSLLFVSVVFVAGCGSLQYRGTSPNVRSFSEDPTLAQSYIGFDFEFAITDPPVDADKPDGEQASLPQAPEDPEVVPQPLPEPKFIPF